MQKGKVSLWNRNVVLAKGKGIEEAAASTNRKRRPKWQLQPRFTNKNWECTKKSCHICKLLLENQVRHKGPEMEFSFDRQISSLMLLFKIIYGLVEIQLIFLPKKARDEIKFQTIYGRVNAYTNSFIPSSIRWWNEIPKEFLIANW